MTGPPDHLTAERFVEHDRRVVALVGELDLASAPIAEDALQADVDVLDLSRLEFMDSGGVRIVLRVCGARTEPLVVRGVTRAVRRILDLTGVSDLLVYE
jgi:anti-anti-sigma factor